MTDLTATEREGKNETGEAESFARRAEEGGSEGGARRRSLEKVADKMVMRLVEASSVERRRSKSLTNRVSGGHD